MLIALVLATSLACSVPATETSTQVLLPYASFDSLEGPYGWRHLNSSGCTDSAVSLLRAYGSSNQAKLTSEQIRELAFHVGQTLAFAGHDAESIPEFERANRPGGTAEWHAYVGATLAFLKHDQAALVAARNAYASIAPGSMRLGAIDGFIKCPREPYAKAVHCAMAM
ncbi:MAG: hypothetical protein ACMG5Z_02010 [Luteimonas sp.]